MNGCFLKRVMYWLTCLLFASSFGSAALADQFLPVHKAFVIKAEALDSECQKNCLIDVSIQVAPGYYLYRERFSLQWVEGVTRANFIDLPRGERKYDQFLEQEIEALRQDFLFRIEYDREPEVKAAQLVMVSQGCAEAGLCYPPESTTIPIGSGGPLAGVLRELGLGAGSSSNATGGGMTGLFQSLPISPAASITAEAPPVSPGQSGTVDSSDMKLGAVNPSLANGAGVEGLVSELDESGTLAQRLAAQPLFIVLPLFFALGLLLSLTPCVLPMLPIVTSLVLGQRGADSAPLGRLRALSLATVYVLGMALTYAVLGALAGLSGHSLVMTLQTPAVLWAFGVILAFLGFALLRGYHIELPVFVQAWLRAKTDRLKGGQYLPVLLMGVLSALLLGPCVAPPLAGALLYIGQTGDVFVGGAALFLLALGMGLPMVLIAAGAGTMLPRAGNWMRVVTGVFGFMLLAVALWVVNPVTASWILFVGWVIWLTGAASSVRVLLSEDLVTSLTAKAIWHSIEMMLRFLALVYLVGLLSGASSLLKPLSPFTSGASTQSLVAIKTFDRVPSAQALEAVRSEPGPVILDFYADWCVSCKEFELLTLAAPSVQKKLAGFKKFQVDVTRNTPEDKALLAHFRLFGPPAILFFDGQNQETKVQRVVGFQNAQVFGQTLDLVRQRFSMPPA